MSFDCEDVRGSGGTGPHIPDTSSIEPGSWSITAPLHKNIYITILSCGVAVTSIMLRFPVSSCGTKRFSQQLRTPTAITGGKELWYSLDKKVGRPQNQSLYSENMSLLNTWISSHLCIKFPFPWPLIMKLCFTVHHVKLQSLLFSTSAKFYVARDKGRVIKT